MGKIIVYVAGNSDNKGKAGIGVVVCEEKEVGIGKILIKRQIPMVDLTNWEIEFQAMLFGVAIAERYGFQTNHVVFRSHNQQTVDALTLQGDVKNKSLLSLRIKIFQKLALFKNFDIELGTIKEVEFLAFEARRTGDAHSEYGNGWDKQYDVADEVSGDRPSWDEYHMEAAVRAASRSSCLRRKVGAVIVKDNRQLTTGYNGAPKGKTTCLQKGFCMRDKEGVQSGTRLEYCHALHAEMNAITQASKFGVSIQGATIYVTHFPCSLCTKLLLANEIERIVYKEGYPDDFAKVLLEGTNVVVEQLK